MSNNPISKVQNIIYRELLVEGYFQSRCICFNYWIFLKAVLESCYRITEVHGTETHQLSLCKLLISIPQLEHEILQCRMACRINKKGKLLTRSMRGI